jgi:PAS domain S-box-containing protein
VETDGTRTFVNQAYCRTFGKSFDELVGTSFFPLVAEPYRETIREKIRSITPATPVAFGVHESLLPDGATCWQEWADRGLFDERGRLIELQSVGRDITERKRAEEALRASEERIFQGFLPQPPSDGHHSN